MRYFEAFLFGATLAIAIGPIALLVLRASMQHGVSTALSCGMGAATGDWIFAFAAFVAGTVLIPELEIHRREIEMVGSGLLVMVGLGFAVSSFRNSESNGVRAERLTRHGYVTTLVLTMLNPLGIILFASFTSQIGPIESILDAFSLATAVFLGSFIVQCWLILFGIFLRKSIVDARVLTMLSCLSGLGIALFGLRGVMKAQ